ncbi:MAG: tetratricopeptide repeat protein [Nitrospinota bacterium]|nr:MAG: tetratricopeptide repeat protein [Nitrospinota bacterium]
MSRYRRYLYLGLLCLLGGCTLPRLVVLQDTLTPEEHLNLGVAYEEQGEFAAAIQEYKLAAKELPRAYLYLGNVAFRQQEWSQAERYYQKAIDQDPDLAEAYNNLAWLYYTRGEKLEEAEHLARKALLLDPGKAEIYTDTLEKIQALSSAGEKRRRGMGTR